MIVTPGRYRTRGGGIVIVLHRQRAAPPSEKWYFWVGKCEETGATMTWQPDGHWAAAGQNPKDLVPPILPDA